MSSAQEAINGEQSVSVKSNTVEAWTTLHAAHTAPVHFKLDGRTVSPYSISPWQRGEFDGIPDLLGVLRGDFWCMPFGPHGDLPYHGEVANDPWQIEESLAERLILRITPSDLAQGSTGAKPVVTKEVSVKDDHNAFYQEFTISGVEGEWSFGTHPIIDFSKMPKGGSRISSSPIRWAGVYPGVFSDPAQGERQILKSGAVFSKLAEIPLTDGGTLDMSCYPTEPGHEDLVMYVNEASPGGLTWTAATLDGYLWFSLKNPQDLPGTLMWISNGGRSQAPWNSRHLGRIGFEDVCSYFSHSVTKSREKPLANEGIATVREFTANETVKIQSVQGVAQWPDSTEAVTNIEPDGPNKIKITGEKGTVSHAVVDWGYVVNKGVANGSS